MDYKQLIEEEILNKGYESFSDFCQEFSEYQHVGTIKEKQYDALKEALNDDEFIDGITREQERLLHKIFNHIEVSINNCKTAKIKTDLEKYKDKNKGKKDKDNVDGKKDDPQRFFVSNAFKPKLLKDEILSEKKIMYVPQVGFYIFNDKYWEKIDKEEIACIIEDKLGEEVKSNMIDETMKLMTGKGVYVAVDKINSNKNKFAIKNGTIDISDWSNIKFHENEWFADDYCTRFLNVEYGKNYPTPVWNKYLQTTFDDKNIPKIIGEMMGYCLTAETRLETCFVLTGSGGNGKSKVLNILKDIIGLQNIASVKMSSMDNSFSRSMLYNKTLNLCTEINSKSFETDTFKGLVSGEPVQASFKNKDEFVFENYAKMVFACNQLPTTLDKSDGYFRRLQIIPFVKQFNGKDKDVHLDEKLKKEINGIFMFALDGLKRLADNGEQFTYSKLCDEIKNTYKDDQKEPVVKFLENNYESSENDKDMVKVDTIFDDWKEYATGGNFKPGNKSKLEEEIKKVFKNTEIKRVQVDGERKYHVIGLKEIEC